MHIVAALLLVLFAGIINGSFALPMKYMKRWNDENIWLTFSFWGFIVIPWTSMFVMEHRIFHIFFSLPNRALLGMLVGGILFGLGEICFALALRLLGLGLAFVINIGLGTAGGALVPLFLWHSGELNTPYGYTICAGAFLFLIAITLAAFADQARSQAKSPAETVIHKITKISFYKFLGVALALASGISSICEAATYIFINPDVVQITSLTTDINSIAAYNLTWLGIFSGAFIPYTIFFIYKHFKNGSFKLYYIANTKVYWFASILMGICFWISLMFFSKASELIGSDLAPIIAWPMFMIFVILTANFWGWITAEWKHCGKKAKNLIWTSIGLLMAAVCVFGYANTLDTTVDINQHLGTHVRIRRPKKITNKSLKKISNLMLTDEDKPTTGILDFFD